MLDNWFSSPVSRVKIVRQITASHCGPAVMEILLGAQEKKVTQDEVVSAAGAELKIEEFGMTVEEMALACRRIDPNLQFWYKMEATISDLSKLVNDYHQPVGVEWQGIFLPEDEDDDSGHYSVVTQVDTTNNMITLIDPYYARERKFTVMQFQRRWWDNNKVFDPVSGRSVDLRDDHLLFCVLPKEAGFPELLGMSRG